MSDPRVQRHQPHQERTVPIRHDPAAPPPEPAEPTKVAPADDAGMPVRLVAVPLVPVREQRPDTLTSGITTVRDTAVQVSGDAPDRRRLVLRLESITAGEARIGQTREAAANGFALPVGEQVTLVGTAAVYVVCTDSGATGTLHHLAEHESSMIRRLP